MKNSRLSAVLLLVSLSATACMEVRTAGLESIYPPTELPAFTTRCRFVEVDDLQPTFEWEPLSRTPWGDAENDALHPPLENITYEMRIWSRFLGDEDRLIYSVVGLKEAKHRVREPLSASREYFWSVRAHFTVAGKPRVSEWALAGLPLRAEAVPNTSCLRFKTPPQPAAAPTE